MKKYVITISREFGSGSARGARSVRNLAFAFALVVAAVCMAVMFAVRRDISKVFGASDEVAAEVGNILPLFIAGFLFVGFSRIATAYFYATGNTWRAYIVIYGEPLCLLVLLLIIPNFMGITGTWLSVPLSQASLAVVAFLLVFLYDRGQRKREKNISTAEKA